MEIFSLVVILAVAFVIYRLLKTVILSIWNFFHNVTSTDKEVDSFNTQLTKYRYERKDFLMTRSEHDFMQVLQTLFGDRYEVFPQIHLDKFLNHKLNGQDFRAAHSVIQRKSVDFLICGKGYCRPLVAIELDDNSHMRPERVERDKLVDQICQDAGMPLVRIKWQSTYNAQEVMSAIEPYLRTRD